MKIDENVREIDGNRWNSEDEFVRFARAGIVEACAEFAADQYFTQRAAITAKMSQAQAKRPFRGRFEAIL